RLAPASRLIEPRCLRRRPSRLPPCRRCACGCPFPSVSGLQRALPKGDHVGAEKACLFTASADRCTLSAVARLEPVNHEIAVLETRVRRALEGVNEGAVVGDVGGEGCGRDGGLLNPSERRSAIEAMGGAAKEAQGCLASREPDGLHVALHLHGRAPLVTI